MRCISMKDDGHEWHTSSGMAFVCFERLWTKCMRSACAVELSVADSMVILVRNCGSEVLNCVSAARQS
jgi:hypothetical protein